MSRARAAFICDHLAAGTPVGVLLAISGIAEPESLARYARHVPGISSSKGALRARWRAQAGAARSRLEAFINALLEASISVLTGEERTASDGSAGLDATPVPLFSRGPSKRTGLCASDPDGGWYVREGDHREREDDKGKPLRKICWALEATIATGYDGLRWISRIS